MDGYAKVEAQRLKFVRYNQSQLRAELYQGVVDAQAADVDPHDVGRSVLLPSSFIGGPRHCMQCYQDSMAIARDRGPPSLFITMTCNPKWPEITSELKPGETTDDRPDIVDRVFRIKLAALLDEVVKDGIFGKVMGDIYVVEFQKRGLPHAHLLVILDSADTPRSVDDYDRIVSAELPNPVSFGYRQLALKRCFGAPLACMQQDIPAEEGQHPTTQCLL